MDATVRTYASPPHALYHSVFQAGAQDHELKKQYLALLPPQQIIDICLTFDLHVPPYIRSTIWPLDINAAIIALGKTSRASDSTSSNNVPIMDSLTNSERESDDKACAEQRTSSTRASIPREPSSITSDKASTQTQALAQNHHQPYAYPAQPAYPHAPYYPPSSVPYPLHSHLSYTGYPPPSAGYPTPSTSYSPSSQLQDPYNTQAGDDLPSYEEMIVEALMESNDPDGCAPKDLFTWMASRYPLQSNFRPSASQALQKAFKRGRFEKTTGGKYRLNATWEGGNTSRRTTRRPQTLTQSATPNTSTLTPPFTQTPLVHHTHQSSARNTYNGQPYGYPYPSGYPHYPPFAQPLHSSQVPTASPASNDDRSAVAEKEARDAYETAQSILRAINFGGLLQMSNDNDETAKGDTTTASTLETIEVQARSEAPGALHHPDSGGTPRSNKDDTSESGNVAETTAPRAELQAQLVLLAAQLAEIAEQGHPVVEERNGTDQLEEESSEEEDMEAVI